MSLLRIEQGITTVTLFEALKDITAVQHDIKGIDKHIFALYLKAISTTPSGMN